MLDLSKLNEAQRRAVTHPGGPAIVLAGPGSGKTYLIVNRIIYLIEQKKVAPDTILVITFTRAAAYSMQRRFETNSNGLFQGVRFGTFHSFFYEILKEYDSYHNNSLFEPEEKELYVKNIFDELNVKWDNSMDYNAFVRNPIQNLPEGVNLEQAILVAQTIREKMRIERRLDFDDMEELVLNLLKEKPEILKILQEKFKYILIDEYQDTSEGQEKILTLLSGENKEIMVVGDDDQSIYGFRGSKPEVMKNFKVKYPEAKTYFLNMNYRSSGKIVEAATAVINENKNRFYKALQARNTEGEDVSILGFADKNKELEHIAVRILELSRNYPFSDMAVITRGNREQENLFFYLRKKGIPCNRKIRAKSFSEHFISKEILDCLEYVVGSKERAPGVWNKMGGDERKRRILEKQVPTSAIHFIYKVMGYEKILEKHAQELEKHQGVMAEGWLPEWKNVLQMIKKHAKDYKSLSNWIPMLKSYLEKNMQEAHEDGVHILTMHGSKGLEFSYVCIPDVNEGVIPGKRSRKEAEVEEERRLFYVAMTRAKKVLDILYLIGTEEYPRLPSRFLNAFLKNKIS